MIVNFSIICSIVTHNHHQCILVNLDNIMLFSLLFQFVRSEHKGLSIFSRSLFVSNSLFLWFWMSLKIQQIHVVFSSVSSISENNIHVEPLSSDMNQIINRQFVTRILPFQLTEHVFFVVQHLSRCFLAWISPNISWTPIGSVLSSIVCFSFYELCVLFQMSHAITKTT